MNWNNHYDLTGQHAFLSASQGAWVNYDTEKLIKTYRGREDTLRGSRLHELAESLIKEGIELPNEHKTFNMYVNDAIGFKMEPEQLLYYSENCFGTADSISFRRKTLRISDLKTGMGKAKMRQLHIYAAIFCLEYKINPKDIKIVLRIYQFDDIYEDQPPAELIEDYMKIIVGSDKVIRKAKEGGY